MRKHLLLENFLGVAQTAFPVETSRSATIPDVVECNLHGVSAGTTAKVALTNLAVLDDETLVDTGLQHFQHLVVLHVVTDMLENVAVRDDTQCTEDDPNRDVDLDVGYRRLHDITQLQCMV